MRHILSELSMGGVTMQRASYRWKAGDELADYDDNLTLKLVSGHHPVKARCIYHDKPDQVVGRLIVTPPTLAIRGFATDDETDMRSTVFHIDGELLARSLEECGSGLSIEDFEADLDLHDPQIEASLVRLANELERGVFGCEQVVDALTRMLIIDLARHAASSRERLVVADGGLCAERLRHIRNFVENFDVGSPTPAEVAAECGMSPSHLRRLFKRATGETLQDYIKSVRIARARALLSNTDVPLKVVSYRLGFSNSSAFSFAFHQATGETPGQFRRRYERLLRDDMRIETLSSAGGGTC